MKLPINQIICGDCLEVMKDWPDGCVDLVLTDPPYGINVENNHAIGGRYDKEKDLSVGWDNKIPSPEYFVEMNRISKEQIIWGANYFNCFSGENGAIVWNKIQPLPTMSQCEIASYSRTKKVYLYEERWTNYVNTKKTDHPTEKSLKLMQWLVANFSQPNDLILDPFCGSGTTCVAAKMFGRRYIGIDISSEYCEIARQRLEAVDTGVPVKEQRKGQQALFPKGNQ